MYSRIIYIWLQQPRGRARKGQFRIADEDNGSSREFAATNDDAYRVTLIHLVVKLLFRVSKIGSCGIFQTRHGTERHATVTAKFATDVVGDFLNCTFHELLRRYSATACAVRAPCSIQAGTDTP